MVDRQTEHIGVTIDADGLSERFQALGEDIDGVVRTDIAPSIAFLDDAFQRMSRSAAKNLAAAARAGEVSFRKMAQTIARDLASLAVERVVRGPLEAGLNALLSRLPFGGARAGGGAVAPGASFLVGERGPELFTPSAAGRVTPSSGPGGGAPIIVNFNLPPGTDARSFRKSESQIAAMLARAVDRGARNM